MLSDYIAWVTYVVVLAAVKIALLMLWIELFESPRVRTLSYLVMTWIGVNTLVIAFITIFNCWPVYFFWDKDLKGTFLDINAVSLASACSTIVQDFALFTFPLACHSKWKTQGCRKLGVGVMFLVGIG